MKLHGRRPEETTLTVWQVVELARHPDRPYSLDYIKRMAPDFIEMHGDRISADEPKIERRQPYLAAAESAGSGAHRFVQALITQLLERLLVWLGHLPVEKVVGANVSVPLLP